MFYQTVFTSGLARIRGKGEHETAANHTKLALV